MCIFLTLAGYFTTVKTIDKTEILSCSKSVYKTDDHNNWWSLLKKLSEKENRFKTTKRLK